MDLNNDVRASLRKDRVLSAFRIDVEVRNGIVYLKGKISAQVKDRIIALAKNVNSVAAVVDQMTIQ